MRVLMPIDGSAHSSTTIQDFLRRSWPAGTEVEVLSVALVSPELPGPQRTEKSPDPAADRERQRARRDADSAAETIRQKRPDLEISTKVMEGSPADAILKEAEDWAATLILMGSHGYAAAVRLFRESVAHAVAAHARCKVELVRKPVKAA